MAHPWEWLPASWEEARPQSEKINLSEILDSSPFHGASEKDFLVEAWAWKEVKEIRSETERGKNELAEETERESFFNRIRESYGITVEKWRGSLEFQESIYYFATNSEWYAILINRDGLFFELWAPIGQIDIDTSRDNWRFYISSWDNISTIVLSKLYQKTLEWVVSEKETVTKGQKEKQKLMSRIAVLERWFTWNFQPNAETLSTVIIPQLEKLEQDIDVFNAGAQNEKVPKHKLNTIKTGISELRMSISEDFEESVYEWDIYTWEDDGNFESPIETEIKTPVKNTTIDSIKLDPQSFIDSYNANNGDTPNIISMETHATYNGYFAVVFWDEARTRWYVDTKWNFVKEYPALEDADIMEVEDMKVSLTHRYTTEGMKWDPEGFMQDFNGNNVDAPDIISMETDATYNGYFAAVLGNERRSKVYVNVEWKMLLEVPTQLAGPVVDGGDEISDVLTGVVSDQYTLDELKGDYFKQQDFQEKYGVGLIDFNTSITREETEYYLTSRLDENGYSQELYISLDGKIHNKDTWVIEQLNGEIVGEKDHIEGVNTYWTETLQADKKKAETLSSVNLTKAWREALLKGFWEWNISVADIVNKLQQYIDDWAPDCTYKKWLSDARIYGFSFQAALSVLGSEITADTAFGWDSQAVATEYFWESCTNPTVEQAQKLLIDLEWYEGTVYNLKTVPEMRVSSEQHIPAWVIDLVELIYEKEARWNYDIIYAGSPIQPPKPITQMTIEEVRVFQDEMVAAGSKSSAVWAPQIIRKTMDHAIQSWILKVGEVFDVAAQNRFTLWKLNQRWLQDFISWEISRDKFMKQLSQEWASFPRDMSWESYYHWDWLNVALVSPDVVRSYLDRIRIA